MRNRLYHNILKHFNIEGEISYIAPFGSGHINDTFKIEIEDRSYILQKINSTIFTDVRALMENIQKISLHLKRQALAHNNTKFLHFYTAVSGQQYFIDKEGEYWRLMDFIEGSHSYERAENTRLAYEGGLTIGKFLCQLDSFRAAELKDILPNFHNIDFRIKQLLEAIEQDQAKRAHSVDKEIIFAIERTHSMGNFLHFVKSNNIPIRALHNDTKISNILFDDDGKGICMIDLDTLMPGYVHYDYGDAVRTFCSTANEDEVDLSKVDFKKAYYEAFTEGFLQETNSILTQEEKDSLAFAPKLLTYMIGIRFLTDYLKGDTYYKIKYPQHNLDRARNQFHLLKKMESVLSISLPINNL